MPSLLETPQILFFYVTNKKKSQLLALLELQVYLVLLLENFPTYTLLEFHAY